MRISWRGVLRGLVSRSIGLIVDDGFIAVGAVVALVVTGILAWVPIDLIPHDALGVLLLGIVTVVLLGSLLRAGLAARAHVVEVPAADRSG